MATRRRRARGHIEERPNGTFRAIVYAGTDPLTGKPRQLKETASDWNAAQEALTRLQRQVDERQHPRTSVTVGQVVSQWLEVAHHEDSTRERYDQLIRLYIEPTFGTMTAGKVDAELLERFYARLLACRKLCNGQRRAGHTCEPLAPNTIRKIHFIFRAAFERAVRWRYLGVNEAELAEPPAFERSDPDPPSATEAAALLNESSRDASWCLLLWLTMITGSRRGEICALRWTDLDLDAGLASIERSYTGTKEKKTKTRQKRRIALDAHTVALLGAQLDEFRRTCQALDIPFRPSAFVFSNDPAGAEPLQPRSVSQRYRRLAQRLQLRSTRLHALRHTPPPNSSPLASTCARSPADSGTAAAERRPCAPTRHGSTRPTTAQPTRSPASCLALTRPDGNLEAATRRSPPNSAMPSRPATYDPG